MGEWLTYCTEKVSLQINGACLFNRREKNHELWVKSHLNFAPVVLIMSSGLNLGGSD